MLQLVIFIFKLYCHTNEYTIFYYPIPNSLITQIITFIIYNTRYFL